MTTTKDFPSVIEAKKIAEKQLKYRKKMMTPEQDDQNAVVMAKLLVKAQEIVNHSTSSAAKDFDTAKWLSQWIERPHSALGGRKPAELIGTPIGVEVVSRLLGAIESGAYQ